MEYTLNGKVYNVVIGDFLTVGDTAFFQEMAKKHEDNQIRMSAEILKKYTKEEITVEEIYTMNTDDFTECVQFIEKKIMEIRNNSEKKKKK